MTASPWALRSKFAGSLLGTAVGDSLGAGAWLRPPGRELAAHYTDDTHMTISVAKSLLEKRGFDPEHLFLTFVQDWEAEPWRGYGPGPPAIFRAFRRGEDPRRVAASLYPGGSFGNGAAMRVAPLACLYYDDLEELRRVVEEASSLTHTHPLGIEGALLQAHAIALAVGSTGPLDALEFVEELLGQAQADIYKRKLAAIRAFLSRGSRPSRKEVVRTLGNGVEAFNSVPTAIYAFLATRSFEEALRLAVSFGGDRDTIGAMTGAIAGAYHGRESIPSRWLEELENREYIERLAAGLWELKMEIAGAMRGPSATSSRQPLLGQDLLEQGPGDR